MYTTKLRHISVLLILVIIIVLIVFNFNCSTDTKKNINYNDNFFQNKWSKENKTNLVSSLRKLRNKNYFIYDESLLGYIQLNEIIPWNHNFTIVSNKDNLKFEAINSLTYQIIEDKVKVSDGNIFNYDDIFPLKEGKLKIDKLEINIKYPNKHQVVLDKLYHDIDWKNYCKSMEYDKKKGIKVANTKYISTWSQIKNPPRSSELFENTWVINLDKRKDRWDWTVKELDKIGIKNPKKWTAIDASTDEVNNIYTEIFKKNSPDHLSKQELACYLSHYSLWVYLKENNIQYALIVEDDIISPDIKGEEDFQKVLDESLGFDVMYFGHCLATSKEKKRRFYDHISEKGSAMCTHAYALSKNGIDNLINYANSADVVRQLDIVTRNFCDEKLCYLSHSTPSTDDSKYWGEGIIVQDRKTFGTDIGISK